MDPALTGFVALAALILGLFAWLRADMRRMEEGLRADMAGVEGRLNGRLDRVDERFDRMDARLDRMEARLAAVEHGQAKLEGLLEGLREAIAGRVPRTAAE